MKAIIVMTIFLASQISWAVSCFNPRQVWSWDYNAATRTLELRGSGQFYEVKTLFVCHELSWAHRIAFKSFSSFRVCRGDEVVAIDAWGKILDQCRIDRITEVF